MTTEKVTTIQLSKSVVSALKRIKKYPRETYNEIILDLIGKAEKEELDKFVQEAQKPKMKELWDNEYDEVWKYA